MTAAPAVPEVCPQTGQACPGEACAHECQPLSLDETLKRFHSEARHGYLRTPRYRLHYYSWGEGPPLVFVPGLANDSMCFSLVIPYLSHAFRCIAYDLP